MKKKDILILTLIIALPLLFAFVYCVWPKKPPTSHRPLSPRYEHPAGIDLSHHNRAYDWKKVDVQFVYVRATFGNSLADCRYDIHRKAAMRHSIPVGAYHFLVASASAESQFEFFASKVDSSHISLRPMLDVEESKYWNAPKEFTDSDAHIFIREWCNLCKDKYGKAPIIYTTETLYRRYGLDKDFEDCIWWVANYNKIKDYEQKCIIPFTLHQYSDKKHVEGFYGTIDCNRFRAGKSVEDLKL